MVYLITRTTVVTGLDFDCLTVLIEIKWAVGHPLKLIIGLTTRLQLSSHAASDMDCSAVGSEILPSADAAVS